MRPGAALLLLLALGACSATAEPDQDGGGGSAGSTAGNGGSGGGAAAGHAGSAAGHSGGASGSGGGVGSGVTCGDRRCQPGELCVNVAYYGGFPIDGGFSMSPITPTCKAVPAACGNQPPSCAACIMTAFGCSIPGVCHDLGPQTFDCFLGSG